MEKEIDAQFKTVGSQDPEPAPGQPCTLVGDSLVQGRQQLSCLGTGELLQTGSEGLRLLQ